MRCAVGLSLLLATVSGVLARAAKAEPSSATVRLGWARGEGADGCLDERELESRVRARLGRDPFGTQGERTIEGSVAVREAKYFVELRVRESNGALAGRRQLEVATSDCGKLTEAIVLAVALAIDPDAPLREPTDGPLPDTGSPGAHEPVTATQPSPSEEGSTQPTVPPEPARDCPQTPLRACPACPTAPLCSEAPKTSQRTARTTLRVLGALGVLPNLAPGLGIRATFGGPFLEVAAGTSYFPEQEVSEFGFGLSTVQVGACALAGVFERVTPSLCAEVQAGAMHAVVRELRPLDTGDHFWAALALGPEIRFQPVAPLTLEASVLAVVPVRRPRFAVRGQSESTFESQKLGAVASLGVGLSVP